MKGNVQIVMSRRLPLNLKKERIVVAAVSGGPDSVYLLHRLLSEKVGRIVVGHVNHGVRGLESEKDQEFVEKIAKELGLDHRVRKEKTVRSDLRPAGFEGKARTARYKFLWRLAAETHAGKIALAHTADDQVETILMRVFEGAGIEGVKGIPRESEDGIARPILDIWKEDILQYLKEHKIPYRIDRSNSDTLFERNWIRHVLIPLLEKRYGKSLKKRIFALGERFREIDDYLDAEARKWIRRSVRSGRRTDGSAAITLERVPFSVLPSALRIRILQQIGFDRIGQSPNERLLKAMDGSIRNGGPSDRLMVGNGWELVNRYKEAAFIPGDSKGCGGGTTTGPKGRGFRIVWEENGKILPAQAKRLSAKGNVEVFDAAELKMPLSVRPLRKGDRIPPFGLGSDKKVKEILIDRKIPREERWGRPAVCDAQGTILWVPGVVRSAHAPVTARTRKTVMLKMVLPK